MSTRQVGSGQTYTTIAAALAASTTGDIINIHAGTYAENVSVSVANVTIQANTGDTPIVTSFDFGTTANCTISGITVTGWSSSGAGGYGITQDGGSGLTITNCVAHDGYGRGFYSRNSTKLTITGCTAYSCKDSPGVDGTGIVVISGHSTDSTYTNGVTISNNTIHDCEVDGMQVHGQYFTVFGNNVYNNITTNWAATHPDGIQFIAGAADGFTDCQHFKLYNNIFRNHTQNIFVEGSSSGDASLVTDIHIWNNVVYTDSGTINGVNMDTLGTKGMMIKYTKDCEVVNNTIGRHGNAAVYFQVCGTAGILFKNNIVSNSLLYGLYNDTTASAISGGTDYNIYNCADSAIIWGATFYASRAAFHTAVAAQETNGKDGDPLVNAWTLPTLASGSPCINAGVTMGGLYVTDVLGISRPQGAGYDIGAYEYVTASPGLAIHRRFARSRLS